MRILEFTIDKQLVAPNLQCDFTGIVPGTKGYLVAEFSFSDEWKYCRKVAVFKRAKEEYFVPLKDNRCEIPEEVLKYTSFRLSVIGERDGYRIISNEMEIRQNG